MERTACIGTNKLANVNFRISPDISNRATPQVMTGTLGSQCSVMANAFENKWARSLPKPGKYGGQDDIEKFDDWLTQLLKYFRTFKVTGYRRDVDHVLYTGLYLEGIAAEWYDQEVKSPDRRCESK